MPTLFGAYASTQAFDGCAPNIFQVVGFEHLLDDC